MKMKTNLKNNQIILPALTYNVGIEKAYRRVLMSLVNIMCTETENVVISAYKSSKLTLDKEDIDLITQIKKLSNRFRVFFDKKALAIAVKMVGDSKKISDHNFIDIIKKVFVNKSQNPFLLSGSAINEHNKIAVESSVFENVNLIRSIQEKYFTQIIGEVTRSMQAGGSVDWLRKRIKKYKGITSRRANIIALDQTRKTYQSINLSNMKRYGITKFKWIHSGGGAEPRRFHKQLFPNGLNGGIFDLEKPPIIDPKTGERGYPAQLINCKCVMAGVLDFN